MKRREESKTRLTAVQTLLLQLSEALHQYGIPAHRLEDSIKHIAKELGSDVTVFSMPTGLFVAFQDESAPSTHLVRVDNGDVHFEKQSDIDELAGDLIARRISVHEATLRLKAIKEQPPRYQRWMIVAAFIFTALAVARIFGGSWKELLLSGSGGAMTGLLVAFLGKHPSLGRLIPALASFLIALLIAALGSLLGPVALSACHVSSVIVLIPGLSLTVAMTEISTQHLVSGTARLSGAVGTLLQLGFGLALGSHLGRMWFGVVVERNSGTLPSWTYWLALVLASASFVVLFQARPKDLGWFVMIGLVAMLGAKFGQSWLGPRLGPFLGALLVGLASNLFARLAQRPSSLLLLPGIILLVPGSIGLNSIQAMMNNQAVEGITAAFTTMMVTISLVAGLLVAALLLPPKRIL